jgi:hypothetical protein
MWWVCKHVLCLALLDANTPKVSPAMIGSTGMIPTPHSRYDSSLDFSLT